MKGYKSSTLPDKRKRSSVANEAAKGERRRVAKIQELENRIKQFEAELAQLGFQLEHPPADMVKVGQLGRNYARVQYEMDLLINEWELLQK